MTVNAFIAFAAGAFVSFVICSVYAGAKFWELWGELEDAKAENASLVDDLIDLRSRVEPRQWDEHWNLPIHHKERKERIYDKYPELVQPGSEVLDLTNAEDNDPMGHQDWTYE